MKNFSQGLLDCPCLEEGELTLFKNASHDTCAFFDSVTVNESKPYCQISYGLGCDTHDINATKEYCTIRNCDKAWCYVDTKKCFASKNFYFYEDRSLVPELAYSYTTCNSTWEKNSDLQRQSNTVGQVIDALYPADEYPWHYKDEDTGVLKGALVDYVKVLREYTGARDINYRLPSQGSKKKFINSSYTAAVYDVADDVSQVAIGPFWITTDRLEKVHYTIPYYTTTLYIYQLREQPGFRKNAIKALRPFEYNLWVLSIGCIFAVGILKVVVANARGNESSWYRAFRNAAWKSSSFVQRILISSQVITEALVETCVEYFGQATSLSKNSTFGRKIIMVGFGFFTLILTASYTANLAAFLTTPSTDLYVSNMQEAIDSKKKICIQYELNEYFGQNEDWKKADIHKIQGPNSDYVVRAASMLTNSSCDIFVAEDVQLATLSKAHSKEICDLGVISIKTPISSMDYAFPIQSTYAADFSMAIGNAKLKGGYFNSILESHVKSPECNIYISTNTVENEQIKFDQMILPFMVLGASILIAVTMKIIKLRTDYFRNYRSLDEEYELERKGLLLENNPESKSQPDSYDLLEYKYRLELISLGISEVQHKVDKAILRENHITH